MPLHAQLGFDLKIDKPEPYDNRELKAEKTPQDKPIKGSKRFFQNLTTHYNYVFNASTRLNEVIEGAKEGFRDDYTLLLPFYNYTLDATSRNANVLDSVVYKAQTGIVMHDLRNDWVDNLYLLWGAAWFLEKKFDSAALMFQFINYAFAEKEADGYYKYIGSNRDGASTLTIATKEERKFPKNLVTPPSRNNAFIWQIRTLIELGNFAQSGSLIATLREDPQFPSRLNEELEEVQAYWFYRQGRWDSSATHLIKALDLARNKQERARWEYLAAQMFERSRNPEQAAVYYSKSIGHTTDPVMDVYARLNLVRIQKGQDDKEDYIAKNIAELLKMARRDKYVDYRDVIYFMAAQMELERNNLAGAQELLIKGAKYNNGNIGSKNKTFLLIGDLSYDQRRYPQAASFYDSVQVREIDSPAMARVEERKPLLKKLLDIKTIADRQDSLQRLAALPEEERDAFLNRLAKQLRKQRGIEDNNNSAPTAGSSLPTTSAPADLFPGQSRGEWYFYNNNLRTQGSLRFKQTWGSRPNVDNWRRFADVNKAMNNLASEKAREGAKSTATDTPVEDDVPTYASLLARLPMTPEKMQVSNDSLRNAWFGMGMVYLNEMQDYPSAIEMLEKIRNRFPEDAEGNEVLYHLYQAYRRAGKDAEAEQVRKQLVAKAPGSRYATILTTGKDPAKQNDSRSEVVRKAYENIYDLFIEGRFDEAEEAKRVADSTYRTSYWQPQLLYIESVYQIRTRQDSAARTTLQTLIGQNPNTPMASKAQVMLDVLGRRAQIEEELRNLQVERPAEDSLSEPEPLRPPMVRAIPPGPAKKDTSDRKPLVLNPPVKKDTLVRTAPVITPKKDTVASTSRKDSVISRPKDSVAVKPPRRVDTVVRKPVEPPKPASIYTFEPASPHYFVIVLDKVDPIFVTEVSNSFGRYNRDRGLRNSFTYTVREYDADRKLVLVGGFGSAQEAVDYGLEARRLAPTQILPWLKADKYSFFISTGANVDLMIGKKDLQGYRSFLNNYLPGKF